VPRGQLGLRELPAQGLPASRVPREWLEPRELLVLRDLREQELLVRPVQLARVEQAQPVRLALELLGLLAHLGRMDSMVVLARLEQLVLRVWLAQRDQVRQEPQGLRALLARLVLLGLSVIRGKMGLTE